ncbi:permeability factor 2-like [Rhinatrema bivittatum]|uniref:permeability factor 2-like n=1 Tax=Rhinatrema bivittatum TaxID=194408 RepID=UPI0011266273|nr:permeability factor 2-like [Rhinatrema bivittatum]
MKSLMMSLPLLLLLLLPAVRAAPFQDASARTELRCQCIKTVSEFIPIKQIANVELIPEGPHCPTVEVIANLKNGMQVCLNPEAKWVKIIIDKILNGASSSR